MTYSLLVYHWNHCAKLAQEVSAAGSSGRRSGRKEQKVSLQHGFCWLCGREWSFWILEWKWISRANMRDFPEIQTTLIVPKESYWVININRYLSETTALREPSTGYGCRVPSWTERQWHWLVLLATQLFLPDNLPPEISAWGFSKAKCIFKLYRSKVLHFLRLL